MTEVAAPSRLAALIDYARREPGRCLAIVLVAHVAIWTALPALLSHNLQLDLAEDLALGREWQLGYWKHPPLPWWLADLAYRAVGDVQHEHHREASAGLAPREIDQDGKPRGRRNCGHAGFSVECRKRISLDCVAAA